MILVQKKEDPSGKGKRKERLFFSHAHIPMSSITVIVAIRRRSLRDYVVHDH